MIATVINTITIIIGCFIGLIAKGKISKDKSDKVMQALALCVLYIGISGAIKAENAIIVIVSMVIGTLIGEFIDIDDKLNKFGQYIENKMKKYSDGKIAEAFVTTTLLFCVGAMSVVGSLESGMLGKYDTLLAKSALDGVASIVFSSTLGIGVLISAISVFIYQGIITLCAGALAKILTMTVITYMSAVGSLLIVALGLNMLNITKLKVANMLPAVLIPILLGGFL